MNKPLFISPMLEQIDADAQLIISAHLQRVERVSNDIKTLVEVLKKAAIPFHFFYAFSTESEEHNYSAIYRDHYLVWNKDTNNLTYEVYVAEHAVDDDSAYEVLSELESSKLLNETKVHFRLKIEEELPRFYKKISEVLKSGLIKDYCDELSPNYPPRDEYDVSYFPHRRGGESNVVKK